MRKFTAGSGADTTSTVQSYLETASEPLIKTLVQIQRSRWSTVPVPSLFPGTSTLFVPQFLLTDYSSAVNYGPIGNFCPAVVRHGSIGFEIGAAQPTFDLFWTPGNDDFILPAAPVPADLSPFPTIGPLDGVKEGFFDGAFISIYKTVMPAPGDANTYGITLLQRGVVDSISVQGREVKFTCSDPIAHINGQVPSQIIGPNSRFATVDPMVYTASDLFTGSVAYKGYGPQKAHFIWPDLLVPKTGYFDGGVFVWTAGALAGMSRPIRTSVRNGQFIDMVFAQPFPFDPNDYAPGFAFGCNAAVAALRSPTQSDTYYNGFPYVPVPEDGI